MFKKVKFFERKKLCRKICKIDKEINEIKNNNKGDKESLQKLKSDRIYYENLLTVHKSILIYQFLN